jgi:hypothetical protein
VTRLCVREGSKVGYNLYRWIAGCYDSNGEFPFFSFCLSLSSSCKRKIVAY